MYLCTCGFICDNSNVCNICNIQTNSECTTPYNNAYTSKYDRYKFKKAVTLLERLHSSTTHWIQQSVCWVCGGTQRNTAKRLYTGTQYVVVVTGHSDKMLSKGYIRRYTTVQGNRIRLMQLLPLNLHSHGMKATHLFIWEVLQGNSAKTVQGDSFGAVEDAAPHWPRLDVCRPRRARNLNSRRLHCWKYTGGNLIRRSSLWDSLRFCAVQWAWCSLFTGATMLRYTVSQVYKSQEEKVSSRALLISFLAAVPQHNEDN